MKTKSLDKLLAKLLRLKHGRICQICEQEYPSIKYLMPVHILSKGAYKRLQFVLKNIVWSCSRCHKDYDEGDEKTRKKILDKISRIKSSPDLINDLKKLYEETPLLKNQNIKEKLNKLIIEEKLKDKTIGKDSNL